MRCLLLLCINCWSAGPWDSPGAFSILSYIEHADGVYRVKGGLNKLTAAMAKVAEEEGAVFIQTRV